MLIFIVTLLSLLAVIYFSFRLVITSNFQRGVGPYFNHYVELVREELGGVPDVERIQEITQGLSLDVRVEGPEADWSTQKDLPRIDQLDLKSMSLKETWSAQYADRYYIVIRRDDYSMILSSRYDLSDDSNNQVLLITLGVILFILLVSYKSVQWLIGPIAWIKAGAERIGQGDLQHRIPNMRKDELGDLSGAINQMAADIEKMLEAKHQLLLSISHELRSPITRAKVGLEFVEDEKTRQGLIEDIGEMEVLIDDLLESERLNTKHSKLNSIEVSLNELVREALIEQFQDEDDRIRLFELDRDVIVCLDPTRIKLLIKNIVGNALRHSSHTDDPVEVSLSSEGDHVSLSIKDNGEGIAEEHLAHVTEPFYRVDPSRQRQTGGYGLGLYLCQLIAQAHNGSLDIQSQIGVGTEITVSLPLAMPT